MQLSDVFRRLVEAVGGAQRTFDETAGGKEDYGLKPSADLDALPSWDGEPSVVVVPFVNKGADANQEYLADGLTEDIITALSKFRNLLVIS